MNHNQLNHCLFCKKKRGKSNKYLWKSSIILQIPAHLPPIYDKYEFTICPKCRSTHTIQEFYNAVLLKLSEYFKHTLHATKL